jgi:hypothetical protein
MTKKSGMLLIAAMIFLLIAGGLNADPAFSGASPQLDTTGVYQTDADFYMSPSEYSNVEFDKFFGVASFRRQMDGGNEYESGSMAQIGFGTRLGKIYLGFAYMGNAWEGYGLTQQGNINRFTQQKLNSSPNDNVTWKIFDESPDIINAPDEGQRMRNEAAVVIGLPDFGLGETGFKLYYATNLRTNKQNDFAAEDSPGNSSYYKSLEEQIGHINPGISWGIANDLLPGGRGLRPSVTIDLDFYRKNNSWEKYDSDDGNTVGLEIEYAENKFVPGIDIGTGDFYITSLDNFISVGISANYSLKMHFYNNDYSYQDELNKYKTENFRGGYIHEGSDTTFVKAFQHDHYIVPGITGYWSSNRLSLAAKFGFNMDFMFRNEEFMTFDENKEDGSLIKEGFDEKISKIWLKPTINLAMNWEVVPNRFFLNAGADIKILEAYFETLERTEYRQGELQEGSEYNWFFNEFNTAVTTLFLGATFRVNRHIELQAALGVDTHNTINLFNPNINFDSKGFGRAEGGLFGFANIMATVRF